MDSAKPKVHVVVGSTGAGKSTYARKLATENSALRFAIDEWMVSLFGADRPEDAAFQWYMERIQRAQEMIWTLVEQAQRLGMDCVLEVGLTLKADRDAFLERLMTSNFARHLHVLDVPVDVRWKRVQKRNAEKGETHSLHVTRDMFDFVEDMWEAPDEDEIRQWGGQRVLGQQS